MKGNELCTSSMLLEDFKSKHDFVSLYAKKPHMSHSSLVCIMLYMFRKGKIKTLL